MIKLLLKLSSAHAVFNLEFFSPLHKLCQPDLLRKCNYSTYCQKSG